MGVEVNWLYIFLAALANQIVGTLWYGPLFGASWMKLSGTTKEAMKKTNIMVVTVGSFALFLLMAYILLHTATFSSNYFNLPLQQSAMNTAFWMWLGFIMPAQIMPVIYERQPFKLFAIHTSYQFVAMLVMGYIVGAS